MWRRTRLFEFTDGLIELRDAGEGDEDCAYVDFHGTIPLDGHQESGVIMRYKPTCLGYLRTDVSGMGQLWDETQVRRLAERYGYDLAEVVVYDPKSGRPPLARLKARATRLDAEAVIVPGPEHFTDGQIPRSLVRRLDVITIHPEETHARGAVLPLPDPPPVNSRERDR